jgi:hypothetical protein
VIYGATRMLGWKLGYAAVAARERNEG